MTVMSSTPGRIAAVAIGVPLLLAGIGQASFNVIGLLARSSENHQVSYPWHGGTLSLHAADGDVTVRRSSAVSSVSVSYTEHYGLKKPTVTGRATAAGVELSSKCPEWVFDNYCSVNYVVLVPAGAALKLTTGDGGVTLEGVDGAVTVNSGDGSLHGTGLLTTNVDASLGDGSVSLQWQTAPARVHLSLGDGSLHLTVPDGSGPYAITKHMGDGSSDIGVAVDPKAPRSMLLEMGDGNLSVQ
jgi:Putative adhesin